MKGFFILAGVVTAWVADNYGEGDYDAYALPGSNLVRRPRNGDPAFPARLLLAR